MSLKRILNYSTKVLGVSSITKAKFIEVLEREYYYLKIKSDVALTLNMCWIKYCVIEL